MKKAFTIIELVFVIVILGILAAVSMPKFNQTKSFAEVTKARTDVASVRSAILTERQGRLIKGESGFIDGDKLDKDGLFGGVLTYPIASGTQLGQWSLKGTSTEDKAEYNYKADVGNILFTYTKVDGKFGCDRSDATTGKTCKKIVD